MAESSRRIAVVDDDASVLKALSRALHRRSFQAQAYRSAKEFLASLADGLPECLILDLQMPEMTGLELHHHLRDRGIKIPTIIITAHGESLIRERSEAAGVFTVLSKPLQNTILFAAIEEAMGTRHRGPSSS